jgi:hypothetical protein
MDDTGFLRVPDASSSHNIRAKRILDAVIIGVCISLRLLAEGA